MKRYPKPKKYLTINQEKYEGNFNEIWSRSSWEFRFMRWLDTNAAVLKWSSETTIIPYISPVDKKGHRYFVDFKMTLVNKAGKKKTYLVEVKPDSQTRPPKTPARKTKGYLTEILTWGVNEAKWVAARRFAADRGYEFIIITEKHLGLE